MNTSDNVIAQPVELADADLNSVSAGATQFAARESLGAEIRDLVRSILSDVGIGGPSKIAA